MAVAKKKTTPPVTGAQRKPARPRPFVALLFLIFGLLALLAIVDYDPIQDWKYTTTVVEHNLVGNFGVRLASGALWSFGLAAYMLPVISFWMSYIFFRPFVGRLRFNKLPPLILFFVSLAVFGAVYQIESDLHLPAGAIGLDAVASDFFKNGWGGWIGFFLYAQFLRDFLGVVGTLVVFGVLSSFSVALLLVDNVFQDLAALLGKWWALWKVRSAQRRQQRAIAKAEKAKAQQEALKQAARIAGDKPADSTSQSLQGTDEGAPISTGQQLAGKARKRSLLGTADGSSDDEVQPFAPIVEDAERGVRPELKLPGSDRSKKPASGDAETASPAPALPLPVQPVSSAKPVTKTSPLRIIAGEEVRKATVKLPERRGDYVFPPMSLLAEPAGNSYADDTSVHEQMAQALVRTLDEFGVKVTTGDVHTGPVITRYDVFPAPGVRVEKIVNLDRNIALNLKASSVRILAPVPGKGCVGVEIPNRNPSPVFIRDILESEAWANTKAEIPIALGKEVSGKPMIADLTKMPHLLIAGSTGSGKTVCINAIITSLLYHSSPQDLRFVMVDPKIVEMQVYNSLPHMLVPVVTDPKKVPNALKYLLNEMERRYQMFARLGVRNIAGYNAKMASSRQEAREAEERAAALDASLSPEERAAAATIEVPRQLDFMEDEEHRKLPYIVCVVDELADLMMVAPADIETGIARLAQLARAAGIHLILATQRPSVNVITGVIKANLPSRIAFKVASKVDSRTILDTMGADQLIGKGDMLFLPPGSADLQRAQGAFVGDDEINGIVAHIAELNGPPQFDEQFQQNIEMDDEDGTADNDDGDWDDDLVPQAIEVIRSSRRASTSMLQRRLKIGYNRAARIMELLEQQGMVGPENGSNPREILMPLD